MADAYVDNDVRSLEREAEAVRARLHDTIAEIKDPRTMEDAKLEMKHRAEDMKEQVLGYIRGARDNAMQSGRNQTSDFTRKLQRTAIENPMPILLIGAGLGWHLYKRPPITSALIGAGLYSLMKNWNSSPDERAWRDPYNSEMPRGYVPGGVAGYGYDEVTDVSAVTERMQKTATNLAYGAQDMVAGVQDAVTGAAERVRDAVGMSEQHGSAKDTTLHDIRESAEERLGEMAGEARRRIQPLTDRVAPWFDNEHRGQLGLLMVLAGTGVLAGGLLRNSETGRRWMDEARERLSEGVESMREMTSSAPQSGEHLRARSSQASSRMSMSRMSDQAQELGHEITERAGEIRERGAQYVRSAQEMGSEHPLLLSAIGLAIGAVLGGMIRQTSFERETLAPMAEDLRERAVDTLQENIGQMGERASQVVEKVIDAVGGESTDQQAQRNRDKRVTA